jgi:hypothetical protein
VELLEGARRFDFESGRRASTIRHRIPPNATTIFAIGPEDPGSRQQQNETGRASCE